MVAPIVDELAEEYDGRVKFVKLNTDENPMVAGKYGIRSIPTLLVFKGGEPVGQIVGFRPKSDLAKHLDEASSRRAPRGQDANRGPQCGPRSALSRPRRRGRRSPAATR